MLPTIDTQLMSWSYLPLHCPLQNLVQLYFFKVLMPNWQKLAKIVTITSSLYRNDTELLSKGDLDMHHDSALISALNINTIQT